jgi:TonB family protein
VATKSLSVTGVIWVAFVGSAMLFAQDGPAPAAVETQRKITNRVVPAYPELARKANMRGAVKAEVLVAPDGRVKSVVTKGGNPVLIQAAEHAIYKWQWAPAKHETRETIEVKFDPGD